tara:strand:- start:4938 stop:5219 length:282 start_codon:yes stop_codon:yes gene_type:complete
MKKLNHTKKERNSLIRDLASTGLTHGKIAKTMHCSTSTVSRAIHGRKTQKKKNTPTFKTSTRNRKPITNKTKTRQPKTQRGISLLWGAIEWKY